MRILFISDLWPPFPGGAERYIFNIANELRKRGHEINVLTSYLRAVKTEGINLIVKDIGVRDRHSHGVYEINKTIGEIEPDIIFIHHFFAYEFEKEITEYLVPIVQVIHNRHRINCRLAVYNSDYTKSNSKSEPEDMVIIPPAYGDCVSEEHGENIGFVKPIGHKGIEFIYELADYMPDKKFLILRGEWYTIEDIREKPNVTFIQPVDDIREFYKQCRITLMPSLSEDAGTIPQESAMNGLPCISSDVMGLKETNFAGIRLPLVRELWKTEIERLLSDEDYYNDICERQKEHLKFFNWDGKFNSLDKAIRELCGS